MPSRSPSRDAIAPWLVLASFLALTAFAAVYVWNSSNIGERAEFDRQRRATLDDIRFGIDTYVNVLRAAGGLFAAGENVTRDQFRSYVRAIEVQRRNPGIQGIGYTARRTVVENVGRVYAQDFSRLERYLLFGTPDGCAARVRAIVKPTRNIRGITAREHLRCWSHGREVLRRAVRISG